MKLVTLVSSSLSATRLAGSKAEQKGVQVIWGPAKARRKLKIRVLFVQSSCPRARYGKCEVSTELLKLKRLVAFGDSVCAKLPSLTLLDAIARVDVLLKSSQGPSS